MRQLSTLVLGILLAAGCGKKPPQEATAPDEPKESVVPKSPPPDDNTRLLNNLKGSNQKAKREAVEELSDKLDASPELISTLVDLLKDKTTTGLGKILPTQISSTREAAALALFWGGPKGEVALKDKGLTILRDGLTDPQPAIREHTAHTIGLLGPLARRLSPDVMKLCLDVDSNVRGRAFDALGSIGVSDVPGFATLLNNDNREIASLAAELVPTFPDVPATAIPPLAAALESDDAAIRRSAAAGLATAGSKAASAAPAVAKAIEKSYPTEFDPNAPADTNADAALWRALVQMGTEAVAPTKALLAHKNPLVRAHAAESLGKIGPPARSAANELVAALMDMYGLVVIEAACALCEIGEEKDKAAELVRRAIESPNEGAQLAIAAIPRMGEAGKPLVPVALEKLGSKNPFARFAAVNLVGTLPSASANSFAADLGKLATDEVPDIRYRVGVVLEKLGQGAAPAAEALGNALKAESEDVVRNQFLDALIAMGPGAKPALPNLLPTVGDKTQTIARRIRTISAVTAADPKSKDVLGALLLAAGDDDRTIRAAAAASLGTLDPLPAEALAKLVAIAKSDVHYNPRLAAIRALATAGPRAEPVRSEIEAIAKGPQPGLALWAEIALVNKEGDIAKAAPAIRAAMVDRRYPARAAGAEALTLLGPSVTDLPVLLKLLKDGDPNVRLGAIKCIGLLGSRAKEAVTALISLLSDKESEVRIAAAEALGDMGSAGTASVDKLRQLTRDPLAERAARRSLEKLGVTGEK